MRFLKILTFAIIGVLHVGVVFAYDFEVDGLCYNKLTGNTVEVTYRYSNGNSYSGELKIPEKVRYESNEYKVVAIGNKAFYFCTGLTGSITIPKNVSSIGSNAFFYCPGLTGSLTISDSVISIGFCAFSSCYGLTGSLVIPNSVTSIGNNAFSGCSGLTGILSISNAITSIGVGVFSGCSGLTGSLTIPKGVTTIEESAFCGCESFTGALTIPNSVVSIGESAFAYCDGFSSLNISNSVKTIGKYAFLDCDGFTGSLIIPNSVITIGPYAFCQCYGFSSLTISNSITTIEEGVFYRCNGLKGSLKIPVSVTSIGEYAFYDCTSLNGPLSIPNTVTSIEKGAFKQCISLDNVNSEISSPFSIEEDVFERISSNAVLKVPYGTKSKYLAFSGWTKNFKDVIEEGSNLTYTLSLSSIGNGSIYYNGTTIRNNTNSFSVDAGTNAKISFTPDNGYQIKTVKVNGTNVTSNVSNNSYTISNMNQNISLEVEFEAIPITTYKLSIKATGNGSVTYSGTTIVNKTQSFTVNEGASALLTFNPNDGYCVGSVKVNNTDVTSGVVNNRYTISNITANTTVSVAFEAIPETTYSLSITASGNGSVTYDGMTIKNQTQTFTVNEGAYATLALSAESGYRIASVRVNGSDDTYSVTNNQYTISYISQNTTVEVTFETIPIPTYSLSITATGNGSATFNGTTVKNQTRSFTLDEGTTATVTFSPDNGNSVSSVKVNGNDVTSQISANRYTINNITANATLEVTFQEDVNALTVDGLNYIVTSQSDKTVTFTGGDFGLVLTVPATITQNGTTWKVTGIDNNALKDNTELAAIIWNPEAVFTATVSNPNLLLYVKSAQYAPSTINNVVVNGTANSITLVDAASGNNFYCPQAFTAQSISYTHHYSMITGIGESRGWETIALPFDVQKIEHASKGTIVPFAQWRSGDTTKPFWLYELKSNGFVEASSIKAYTPYIISMPNNPQYADQYQLVGNVTFSAENVTVSKSDNLQQPKYNDRTFVPNYQVQPSSLGYYALNVSNDYFTNNSGMTDGSRFVLNMRRILPFEAYMTTSSTNAPESIGIFDDMATEIQEIPYDALTKVNSVYDLQGRKIEKSNLTKGVYIRNGQKVIIR